MKDVELFDGREMGEDALKLLKKCVQDPSGDRVFTEDRANARAHREMGEEV